MSFEKLKDNKEVYQYLLSLKEKFNNSGQDELADKLNYASKFIINTGGEFLEEAEQALMLVKAKAKDHLGSADLAEINAVLNQIRIAFARSNGQP